MKKNTLDKKINRNTKRNKINSPSYWNVLM